MDGQMMDFPLSLDHIFERLRSYFGKTPVVSRRPDKSLHRTTYGEIAQRVGKLANALRRVGIKRGDRVATLGWNHSRHLEAYFGIPLAGGVLHTLNPRLSPTDLGYIMNHAEDQILIVDEVLLPVWEKFKSRVQPRHVIVWGQGQQAPSGMHDYEALIAPESADLPRVRIDEGQAAGLCYTSGTTGMPKGVLYSHRALVLHSLASALPDALGLSQRDTVMPVVPMFHVNAWGLPFTCAMVGARLVFPGPCLDAASLLELLAGEGVTCTAGVPTIWMGILEALDKNPRGWDLSRLKSMIVGGSAAPQAMIEAYQKRHGLRIVHAWGMTEMTPIGTVSRLRTAQDALPEAEQFRIRATQGPAVPLVETRVVGDHGILPWDGKSMGELEVRGPWVAKCYFENPEGADRFTADGWFKTGDVAVIEPDGNVRLTDRAKDLIKSGGEWISSVELENALMGHPAVKEAAVVAVAHPKWSERPVACVVFKDGATATDDELRAFLAPRFMDYQLPDAYVRIQEIPKTAAGKFRKSALRELLRDFKLPG
jgi:fatty-acyl-CoA synthase